MAKVFVTQIPYRRDRATGAFVPSFNIAPASEHGELVVIMPSTNSIFDTKLLTARLYEYLSEYSVDDGDSILMAGDPAIIAVAGAVLANFTDRFRLLKWDREMGKYFKVEVNL